MSDRLEDCRPRGGISPTPVAGRGAGTPTRCRPAAGHLRLRGSNAARTRHGRPAAALPGKPAWTSSVCHSRPAPASGTGSSTAVLPDQPRRRSPAPDQLRRHHRHHRPLTMKTGLLPSPSWTRTPTPLGRNRRRADARHRVSLLNSAANGTASGTRPCSHSAAPRPARAAPPDQARQEALNHPALTGLQPGDVKALAAALEAPFDADREKKNHLRRGACASTATPRRPPLNLPPTSPATSSSCAFATISPNAKAAAAPSASIRPASATRSPSPGGSSTRTPSPRRSCRPRRTHQNNRRPA